MARPPSYATKWNAISKFIDNPCHAPWTVYFETALPFAGQAVMELFLFGWDDVVRGYARPRSARGRPHRPFRRRRRRGGGIPEIGEMIGKRLPGAERAAGRQVSDGVRHLWALDGVIQRGLWYWMIADLSFDFLYNWLTAIQASEYCVKQGGGTLLTKEEGFRGGPTVCAGLNNWMREYPDPGPTFGGAVFIPSAGGQAVAAASVSPDIGTRAWIQLSGSAINPSASGRYLGLIPGLFFDCVTSSPALRQGSAVMSACKEGSAVDLKGISIAAIPR